MNASLAIAPMPIEPVQLSVDLTQDLEHRFVSPENWDRLAVEFLDIMHEQSECYNALRWAPEQLDRIAFYKSEQLVGAAVILKMDFPIVGGGIAVVKWGPLWRHRDLAVEPQILEETVECLKDIYANKKGYFLTFFPRADPDISDIEVAAFEKCGFTVGEELASPDRYFVNTHIPLDELRASFAQKWRYNLKKAEKNGMTCRFANDDEGYESFMQLYQAMQDRKAFHDTSSLDTLKDLMSASEVALRPEIMLVEHEGELVAGAVIDASGERAVYLYGATNDRALPLKAGFVMHWEIARYLVENPVCRWYDLGGADKDCHLHQFKRGFVGKKGSTVVTPRYYHYGATLKSRLLGHALYFARRKKGELARLIHDIRNKGIKAAFLGLNVTMSKQQLKRLFSHMAMLTMARVIGAICIFATTILITREFGATMMAQYSVFLAIASLASVLLPCGFHAIGSMMAAEYSALNRKGMLGFFTRYGQRLILVLGLVAVIPAAIAAAMLPSDGSYNIPIILAGAVPSAMAMGYIYFNGSILIGLQHQFSGQLPDMLLRPLLLISGIGLMALLVDDISIWHLVLAATVIFITTAGIQWVGLKHALDEAEAEISEQASEKRKWWQMAPSWTVITVLWDYFIEIHIILASLLFAPFEVAMLHISFRIRQLAGFGMKALYSILMPKVFSANAQQQTDETQNLIRLSTRITLAYAVLAWISIALIGQFVLGLFGDEFRQGHIILMIIMGTLPIRALFGPAPAVLGMKRNHRQVAQILLASLALSLALTMGGFEIGGLTMVAWGYLAATAFTAIAMWLSAKQKTGINCAVWA